MKSRQFRFPLRIYIEDTDAGGIVFYANYLKFFERARTELVRSLGIALRASLDKGVSYVVHSLDVQYHQPAVLDDEIEILTSISKLGKTYICFEQIAQKGADTFLVTANVKVACVSYPDLKPIAIETKLAEALKQTIQG